VTERTARFHELHQSGCFVMPNPWDSGSARLLDGLGFSALATTSSGFAWSLGRPDNHVTLDEALAHLRIMCGSVTVPVNADFEKGFAVAPEKVAATALAVTINPSSATNASACRLWRIACPPSLGVVHG